MIKLIEGNWTDDSTLDCGHAKKDEKGKEVGYAVNQNGKSNCYNCCAENDKIWMDGGNHQVLYLEEVSTKLDKTINGKVDERLARFVAVNWPGTLRIPLTKVNIGKKRYSRLGYPIVRITVYFTWNKMEWFGTVGNYYTGSCFVARPLKKK